MEDTKSTKNIKTYVLATKAYPDLLPNFIKRFSKFWGGPLRIYVSDTPLEDWSGGVIDMLEAIDDEYLIILHDDFYLTEKVDLELLEELKRAIIKYDADRVSLLGNHSVPRTTSFRGEYVKHKPKSEYQFSFEASIYKRKWVLEYLVKGRDPWQSENIPRWDARGLILSSDQPAITYKDRLNRGKLIRLQPA